jgi:plastocyanin
MIIHALLAITVAVPLILAPVRVLAQADAGSIAKGKVVLPKNSGSVQDVVVYLQGKIGDPRPTKAVIDQKEMKFIPRVVAVAAGGSVEFLNSDPILHNVFSSSTVKRFDLGMFGKGESRTVLFETPGTVKLGCNVHPQMEAYILVLENNFFVHPDASGNFEIAGIPPGRYKLIAWHESLQLVETWVNLEAAKLRSLELRFKR